VGWKATLIAGGNANGAAMSPTQMIDVLLRNPEMRQLLLARLEAEKTQADKPAK